MTHQSNVERAIEKAIEGGYFVEQGGPLSLPVGEQGLTDSSIRTTTEKDGIKWTSSTLLKDLNIHKIFSDLKFWQALGKSLGWKIESLTNMNHEWLLQWQSFILHLAAEKDPEDFFADLLNKK